MNRENPERWKTRGRMQAIIMLIIGRGTKNFSSSFQLNKKNENGSVIATQKTLRFLTFNTCSLTICKWSPESLLCYICIFAKATHGLSWCYVQHSKVSHLVGTRMQASPQHLNFSAASQLVTNRHGNSDKGLQISHLQQNSVVTFMLQWFLPVYGLSKVLGHMPTNCQKSTVLSSPLIPRGFSGVSHNRFIK